MTIAPLPSGAQGVDTILTFTPARAKALKAAKSYSFVVRYLGALTAAEAQNLHDQGLGISAVTFGGRNGWQPSAQAGTVAGQTAVAHARVAGCPPGMTLYFDAEGPGAGGQALIDHLNTWARVVQNAGYVAGLYVGWGLGLTSTQLYQLAFTAYWKSCSNVPPVAVRGYHMVQQGPPNRYVNGLLVDINTVQADAKGNTPIVWMP